MADGGVWTLLSDEQMTALDVDERWYRVYPPLIPEPEVLPPFELITGYTIDHVGTSASLVGGTVTFTGVTSLSLNGVFSADFDNYVVSVRAVWDGSTGGASTFVKVRANGTDASSGYTSQYLRANGTPVSAERFTSQTSVNIGGLGGPLYNGTHLCMYGPYLAQPTAMRSVLVRSEYGAQIHDVAATHSTLSAYDGFTYSTNSATGFTGTIQVYGVRS